MAKISGTYRVEVTSYEKARYKITLIKKRRASAQEKERFAAEEKAKSLTDFSRRGTAVRPLKWTNAADRLEIIGRYEESAKWWHQAGDHVKEYDALGEVSGKYGSLGDFQMSLRTLEKSLLVAREVNKPTFEFTTLSAIGLVYRKLNEPQRAIEYLRKAIMLLQSEKMRRDWLGQYKPGGHSDFTLQSYAHLQLRRTEILERRTRADLYELEARMLIYIAEIYQDTGEAAQSAEVYTQALAAARSSSKEMLAYGYGELSGIVRLVAQSYINAQQRERAHNLIEEEIKRAAGSALEPMLRELLEQAKLGDVYPEKKPPATGKLPDIKPMTTRAGQYLDEAAKLREENTNDAKRRAIAKYEEAVIAADENQNYDKFAALRIIAELYKELGEPDRALEYWRRLLGDLRLASSAAQPLSAAEAGALEQIGVIYDERGDYPAALENYQQALNLTRNRDNYNSIMTIKKILEIHRRTNQAERAAEFLEREIAQARVDKNPEVEDTLSEILDEFRKGHNNIREL